MAVAIVKTEYHIGSQVSSFVIALHLGGLLCCLEISVANRARGGSP
jgi:hypothetical protein